MAIGDRLVFRAQFDQRFAGEIKLGDRGKFYLRARPGVAFDAEVVRIGPIVQSDPRTVPGQQLASLAGALSNATVYPYSFSVWLSVNASLIESQSLLGGMNGYCLFENPTGPWPFPRAH